jgi:putative phage-type endonuclease
MAAILGLDPRRNAYDVWLEKTGKLDEQPGNDAMYAGTMFEDGVLQFAEQELGKLTRNQYRSARDRGIPLGANIDAILVDSGIPVEAKTAGLFGPIRETWGVENTDEVPDRVLIQATVHMICSVSEMCHVAAFLGGRGFQMFTVGRDASVVDIVSETAVQFWQRNVLADIPPDNTLPNASSIKRIRRQPESIVEIGSDLVLEWLAAKETLKAAEKAKEEKEIAMLTALGQAEGGTTEIGMLTYLPQSRTTIDAKNLKAENPAVYEQFARVSTYRVARFKPTK